MVIEHDQNFLDQKRQEQAKLTLIHKLYRKFRHFGKYLVVGIAWTILNIAGMWLLIDVLKFPTLVGSSLVVAVVFFGKYYSYILIRLINKNFLKYASINIISAVANVLLMLVFVDLLHISTVISSAVIVYGLFLLRFVAFNKTGLTIQ